MNILEHMTIGVPVTGYLHIGRMALFTTLILIFINFTIGVLMEDTEPTGSTTMDWIQRDTKAKATIVFIMLSFGIIAMPIGAYLSCNGLIYMRPHDIIVIISAILQLVLCVFDTVVTWKHLDQFQSFTRIVSHPVHPLRELCGHVLGTVLGGA